MRLTPVLEGLQGKTNTPQIVEKMSLGTGIVCDSQAPCFSTMESSGGTGQDAVCLSCLQAHALIGPCEGSGVLTVEQRLRCLGFSVQGSIRIICLEGCEAECRLKVPGSPGLGPNLNLLLSNTQTFLLPPQA